MDNLQAGQETKPNVKPAGSGDYGKRALTGLLTGALFGAATGLVEEAGEERQAEDAGPQTVQELKKASEEAKSWWDRVPELSKERATEAIQDGAEAIKEGMSSGEVLDRLEKYRSDLGSEGMRAILDRLGIPYTESPK